MFGDGTGRINRQMLDDILERDRALARELGKVPEEDITITMMREALEYAEEYHGHFPRPNRRSIYCDALGRDAYYETEDE